MNDIAELHRQAMEHADHGDAAVRSGDAAGAERHFRAAFESERRAAEQLIPNLTAEPSRSVLLRSAAALAVECHEYREAERLAAAALAGNPPAEVCEELRDLLERLYEPGRLRQAVG